MLVLVMSGSSGAALQKRFERTSEPRCGRADRFIALEPFPLRVEAEILDDYAPNAENDDLLALHVLTGGVVWLIEDLMERGAVDLPRMADAVFQSDSKFIMEGESELANEFPGDASRNRTILQALASGKTKREELQEELGPVSASGFLSRLEKNCGLIAPLRPALSLDYRRVRYELSDRYLAWWLAFIQGAESELSQNRYAEMRDAFLAGYAAFSRPALRDCFTSILLESGRFREVGPWWDRRGFNEIEIDIVAVSGREILLFEVKRSEEKINPVQLANKAQAFFEARSKLQKLPLRLASLTLEDLRKSTDEIIEKACSSGFSQRRVRRQSRQRKRIPSAG